MENIVTLEHAETNVKELLVVVVKNVFWVNVSLNSIFALLMTLLMFNTASYQDTLRSNAQSSTISEPQILHIVES